MAHVVAREALTPQTLAGAIRAVLENPSYTERVPWRRRAGRRGRRKLRRDETLLKASDDYGTMASAVVVELPLPPTTTEKSPPAWLLRPPLTVDWTPLAVLLPPPLTVESN